MDYEESTVAVFSQNANDYKSRQTYKFQEEERTDFIKSVQPGGKVLDLGCGPGRDALIFKQSGFDVLAVDGAEGMVKLASELGLKTKVIKYSQLDELKQKFDGIWASYSLLHVPKRELVSVLNKIKKLLNPGGVLYASFRFGDGEEQRKDDRYAGGRYFAYYNTSELEKVFGQVFENFTVGEVRNADDKPGPWVKVVI